MKQRRALVAKFYGIARCCKDLNNYNAVLEIVSVGRMEGEGANSEGSEQLGDPSNEEDL